jgi:uncharacterized caspase-like protein
MHRYLRHVFWALLAVALSWSTASYADKRVALVIGNGAYKNVANLPNPPKDATAIAALLRNVGFDVVQGTDLNRTGMTDTLRKFASEAENADVAVFFYAGHGLQLDGKNYLLPVDSNPKSEIDVKLGGPIEVDTMLDQIMSTAKVKLVFLDACRDNPFVEQISRSVKTRSLTIKSGMAEMKSSEGTLLAFATAPGQVALDGTGGHSPFTKALLDNLAAPNEEISVSLTKVRAEVADLTKKKQSPWASTNLTGLFYMNKTATADTVANDATAQPATAAAPMTTAKAGDDPVEMEFWRTVKDSYKPEELNAYLTRYPNGAFSPIARARLASLQDAKQNPTNSRALTPTSEPAKAIDPAVHTVESSRKTEEGLGLERRDRIDIQRRLKALGFATNTKGRFGDDTRRAIKNWQGARNYPDSSFLNQLQWDALRAEEVPKAALADNSDEDDKPARHESRRSRHSGGGGGGGGSRSGGGGPPLNPMGVLLGGFGRR